MTRCVRVSLAAVLAGLAAVPSAALAALDYDLSLGARVMGTDNLYLDAEPQADGQPALVAETIYAVVPDARLSWSEGRDRLSSSYHGEYWTFAGDEDRDPEWINQLAADLSWRRWDPYFLESNVEYARVPRNVGDQNEAILDQVDQLTLSVRTGFAWPIWSSGTVELAYRGERESFSGGEDDEDDRIVRHYAEGLARRRWGPLWESEISARYGLVSQDLADDYTEVGVTAGLNHRLSDRLRAGVRAEWVSEDPDADEGENAADKRTTFLKAAELRRDLERGGFWSLSYEDRLEDQSDGDTVTVGRLAGDCRLQARLGSEITVSLWHEDRKYRISDEDETAWGPALTVRWIVAPWAALDIVGNWVKTTTREPGTEEVEDRTTAVGGAFVFVLGNHLTAETGYLHRENDSTEEDSSYTADIFYAELKYAFKALTPGTVPRTFLSRVAASVSRLSSGYQRLTTVVSGASAGN